MQTAPAAAPPAPSARNADAILAEAVAIGKRFRAAPRAPRDPHAVVRLLALREESGLSVADFARRVGVSAPTVYLWAKGCSSSGNPWPALAAALAKRNGAALAADLNAGLAGLTAANAPPGAPSDAPAPLAAEQPEAAQLASRRGRGCRGIGAFPRSSASRVDAPTVGERRVVEVREGSVIVVEALRLVREELQPGTPEHLEVLRDLVRAAASK